MSRRPWAVWMFVCLAVLGSQASTACAKDDAMQRPNFIVIFCDNLGYGDVEPFGSQVHRTPCLNRMAREGRKFTHFYVTAGVCTPSRASLLTGCYAQRVGMHVNPRDGHVLRPVSPYGLHPDELTIAEVLKQRGYATAVIGKWHLGDQPSFLPTRQGFDAFFGVPYSDDMTADVGRRLGARLQGELWPPLPLMDGERVVEAPVDRSLLTRRYTQRAIEFIEQHQEQPFFLYLPHAMPGSTAKPFSSPPFVGASANGPWGDSVEELDWSTGQILDALVERELDRRTWVIWTSDNGAPLAKDIRSPRRGSNLPLHGRGYTTAEGAFRVPMIAWAPGRVPAATICDELSTTMDVLPTLARLSGAELPEDRVIDGHDVTGLLRGVAGAKTPYEALYFYDRDQLQAVRQGRWKLFLPIADATRHPHLRPGDEPSSLLFDVVADVSSSRNVASEHPEVVARLTRLAAQARQDLGDRGKPGTGQRALGRVDNPTPRKLELSVP